MMKVVAGRVTALVGMYTDGCRMAAVQPGKNLFAISVKRQRCGLSENLLQRCRGALCIHGRWLITASKGDTSVARLDCCKCR